MDDQTRRHTRLQQEVTLPKLASMTITLSSAVSLQHLSPQTHRCLQQRNNLLQSNRQHNDLPLVQCLLLPLLQCMLLPLLRMGNNLDTAASNLSNLSKVSNRMVNAAHRSAPSAIQGAALSVRRHTRQDLGRPVQRHSLQ